MKCSRENEGLAAIKTLAGQAKIDDKADPGRYASTALYEPRADSYYRCEPARCDCKRPSFPAASAEIAGSDQLAAFGPITPVDARV